MRVHHAVVFNTTVLHFKVENTPLKDTNGKVKLKRCSVSFLWTNESMSLRNCPSRNSTFLFSSRRSALPVLKCNQFSEGFEEISGMALYMLKLINIFSSVRHSITRTKSAADEKRKTDSRKTKLWKPF